VWLCWAARCGYGGDGTRAAPTGESGWWWCVRAVGCWALGASLDRHGGGFRGGLQDIVSSRGSPEAGDRTWSRAQDCLLRPSQRCLGSR
jgi:hypothetical protein